MWSPTQAMGRYATTSSSGPSPSKATAFRAVTIRFSCVSIGALGLAGRARRVADDSHVVAGSPRDLRVEGVRSAPARTSRPRSRSSARLSRQGSLYFRMPARIVVDDVLEAGALRAHVQELVHLLLVLDHREPRLGVVHDELHLLLDRVLVQRHRHSAERLRRQHRPVERGAIVADDRGLVAAGEAERGEAERDQARLREVLTPAVATARCPGSSRGWRPCPPGGARCRRRASGRCRTRGSPHPARDGLRSWRRLSRASCLYAIGARYHSVGRRVSQSPRSCESLAEPPGAVKGLVGTTRVYEPPPPAARASHSRSRSQGRRSRRRRRSGAARPPRPARK